jgi:hypothetical protein
MLVPNTVLVIIVIAVLLIIAAGGMVLYPFLEPAWEWMITAFRSLDVLGAFRLLFGRG